MMNDLSNKVSLYYLVSEKIENEIKEGKYLPGTKIPSERELCDQFQVSRVTVRQAVGILEREGYLKRIQGKGTFVEPPYIQQDLNSVYSFSAEMNKQGKVNSTKVICKDVVEADKKLAERLGINEYDPVVFLERLRIAEDKPIIVERSWFPYAKYQYLLNIDFTIKGLYRTLSEDYGIVIDDAVEKFKVVTLNAHECKLLNCPRETPGLMIKRFAYYRGKTVSYSTNISKGESFEFAVHLKGIRS